MSYTVYIVECADESLYTGITTDIDRRLREHNGEKKGGAKYTSQRTPVRVRYTSEHESRSSAQQEEYRIKQLSRSKKQELINSQ